LKMFPQHRRLAMAGLGLVAIILIRVLFSISPLGYK
jgi:hypothetical protein